jgi:hypothetical protein
MWSLYESGTKCLRGSHTQTPFRIRITCYSRMIICFEITLRQRNWPIIGEHTVSRWRWQDVFVLVLFYFFSDRFVRTNKKILMNIISLCAKRNSGTRYAFVQSGFSKVKLKTIMIFREFHIFISPVSVWIN